MKINLQSVVDEGNMSALQIRVIVLCALVMMIDGYDLTIIGVALPTLINDMKIDPSVAGLVASCALIGMMVGAMSLGALADKIGRVRSIALCVFIFSSFTAIGGFAEGAYQLAALRFIAGIGLGGVLPSVLSSVSEISPKRVRSRMTMLMFAAYPIGGILATLLGKQFMELYGWQIVFYVAAVPLALIPFILKGIPESSVLLQKRGDHAALRALAKRIDPSLNVANDVEVYVPLSGDQKTVPVVRLFREGRAFSTFMLWLGLFSGLFTLYALHSWLTKLMGMAGHSVGSSLTFLMFLNIGAVTGSCLGGWLADRFGLKRVLALALIIGGTAIALLAQPLRPEILMGVVFVVGLTVPAGQGLCFTYSSQFYPSDIRSTGTGMATGIGRIGGILAPMIIGLFISLQLPFAQNFYVIAMFALLQAVAVMLINNRVADFYISRSHLHPPRADGIAARSVSTTEAPR
ncbi:MFS transporter [Pseudomonas aeruginosa]|uniref:MFS transporter n=1 Tax=Pseudomonas aeruginosa TaxID=287 RepID=UPI002F909242